MRCAFLILLLVLLSSSYGQSLSWAKNFGGGDVASVEPVANAIVRDDAGNIYTTGSFTGTGDFDPGAGVFNLTSGGGPDVFISKLDANGNFIWAKSIGGLGPQKGFHITLDTTGNIYVAGTFGGAPDFDPGVGVFTIPTSGGIDNFIMKLDPLGNFLWAKSIGGSLGNNDNIINSIVVDLIGNIYFTGSINSGNQSFDLDPNAGTFLLTLPLTAFSNIYAAKWDMNGNFVWAKQLVAPVGLNSAGNDIKLDALGNVFIVGSFGDVLDFDPGVGVFNMGVAGTTHAFLWVLNNAGNFIAAREFGGAVFNESAKAMSLNFDTGNNIYITGTFGGTADFDPNGGVFNLSSPSTNTQSLFVIKLSPIGILLWAKAVSVVPGFINTFFGGVGSIGSCGITIIGSFIGTADFDPNGGVFNLSSTGIFSYILQLDPNGNFVYALIPSFSFNSPLIIDGLGNMYGVGAFSGTKDFDLSPNTFNLTAPATGNATFVVKLLPSPWTPNVISPVSACLNSADTLFASTTLGSTLSWYDSISGGTFLGSGNSYTTPILIDTTIFYVQDSTCQAGPRDSITVNTISCIPLPITLLSFEATNIQNKSVLTEWTTSAEINNDYFTIERSTDAVNFEPIGTVQGAGNSNIMLNYQYMDATSNLKPQTSNTLYYRLKQTDFNGHYKYFDIKAVKFDNATSLINVEVYPNPTTGKFFINLQHNDYRLLNFTLTDALGKNIEMNSKNTTQQVLFSIPSTVPKGIYFLTIQKDNEIVIKKIIRN